MNNFLEQYFGLSNKTAIVIGASRGIGKALAEGLADAGADVYGFGRSSIEDIELNKKFKYKSVDFSVKGKVKEEFIEIYRLNGQIDILVNAAGISLPESKDLDNFKKTLNTNLLLAYESSTVLSELIGNKQGASIINITSIGSYMGFPKNPSYVASKAALRNMTKALAIDFSDQKIRVNNIAPGYIHTDMTNASFNDAQKSSERLKRMIIKRWGQPEDLIGAAVFLASSSSSYITGSDIVIDGGWTSNGL